MSPPTQFGFAASMSAGESTTRPIGRGVEVLDVPADPRHDPVGVGLAQLLRPAAVAGVDLARRVALRPGRQLLELHPEHPGALGRPRRVERERLPERDRRLGREQAAVGLVDRARDAVEPGSEVEQRHPREPLVAAPARPLVQREVDLHLAAPVAEATRGIAHARRRVALREQGPVELRRASRTRAPRVTRGSSRRRRAGLPVARPSETRIRSTSASVRSSPPASRTIAASPSTSLTPPPLGTGIPPSWSAQAITCVMNPDGLVRAEPGVQHPRREQPVGLLALEVSVSQSRADSEHAGRRTRRGRGDRSAEYACRAEREALPPTRARCRGRRRRGRRWP